MRFKEEFLKELAKRLKENINVIESSFKLSNIDLVKNKLYSVEPIEYHLSVLVEDDPYEFLGKLIYSVINNQNIKVSASNICCDLLLYLINLILDEFEIERIGKIG